MSGQLPSAGEIATRIKGPFHDLRKYLNEHASHFRLSPEAFRHILRMNEKPAFSTQQPFDPDTLKANSGLLFAFLVALARGGVSCLDASGGMRITADALGTKINRSAENGFAIFPSLPN
ncbi:MAG: hypothetical protein ACR2JB_14465 [Bryobacteraceae bacterium]